MTATNGMMELDCLGNVPEPGLDLHVTASLPWDLDALRPTIATFTDPDDWYIVSLIIGGHEQLQEPMTARALSDALASRGKLSLCTIQRRMEVEIVARAQKPGQRFHCVLAGPAARAG